MKKKQLYKKYIHEMACISIAVGSVSYLSRHFPVFKEHHAKMQKYINEFVPNWNHIGRWGKATKEIDKKYSNWIDNHIPKNEKLNAIEFITTVIALLTDLLTTVEYRHKAYIERLLQMVEECLVHFDDEDIENSVLGFEMANGF